MRKFDVIFLGGGSGAEMAAPILAGAGRSVAIVEERLLGGECPYFACIPSKAMLHKAAEFRALHRHSAKVDSRNAWQDAISWRDAKAEHRSDQGIVARFTGQGIEIIRGRGVISAPGRIAVSGDEFGYRDLVLNCGSKPSFPEIAGLETVAPWTSDQALSSDEFPESLLVLGGSAVACELAQVYARFGCKVTLLHRSAHLMTREESRIGEILQGALEADGVEVHTNVHITRAEKSGDNAILHTDSRSFEAHKILAATGRHPDLNDIGLEKLGISDFKAGVATEDHLRVRGQQNLWAIGDCNGHAPYTHTANYEARIAAANILGGDETADHRAIPRGTYTDPSVAAVGLTTQSAERAGIQLLSAGFDLANTSRAFTDGIESGWAWVAADARTGLLAGAAVIAPHAEEMISEMSLAIGAAVPVSKLAQTVHPFPSLSEVWEPPLRELAAALARD